MDDYHRSYDRDSGRWVTHTDCPSCAALRARVEVLEEDYKSLQEAKDTVIKHYNLALEYIDQLEDAVEWALTSRYVGCHTYLQEEFIAELKRRAGRGG